MKRDNLIQILEHFQLDGDFDLAVQKIEQLYTGKGRGLSSSEKFRKESLPYIEQIYKAYPRREAKPKAFEAIRKALANLIEREDQTLQQAADYLLLQTERYADIRYLKDSRFTPMPATWFNQERFNDLAETDQPSEQLFS